MFNLEDAILFAEDFLHEFAIYILAQKIRKLEKEVKKIELAKPGRLCYITKQVESLRQSIEVLEKDREVKARRARIRLIK